MQDTGRILTTAVPLWIFASTLDQMDPLGMFVDDLLWVLFSAVAVVGITVTTGYTVSRAFVRVSRHSIPIWSGNESPNEILEKLRTIEFWGSPAGVLTFWGSVVTWPFLLIGIPIARPGAETGVVITVGFSIATFFQLLLIVVWTRYEKLIFPDVFTAYENVTEDASWQVVIVQVVFILIIGSAIFWLKKALLLAGLSETEKAIVATEVNRFSLLLSLHAFSLLIFPAMYIALLLVVLPTLSVVKDQIALIQGDRQSVVEAEREVEDFGNSFLRVVILVFVVLLVFQVGITFDIQPFNSIILNRAQDIVGPLFFLVLFEIGSILLMAKTIAALDDLDSFTLNKVLYREIGATIVGTPLVLVIFVGSVFVLKEFSHLFADRMVPYANRIFSPQTSRILGDKPAELIQITEIDGFVNGTESIYRLLWKILPFLVFGLILPLIGILAYYQSVSWFIVVFATFISAILFPLSVEFFFRNINFHNVPVSALFPSAMAALLQNLVSWFRKQRVHIHCPHCGDRIKKTHAHCPDCGDPFVVCNYCYISNKKNNEVCTHCGEQLPEISN